MDVDKINEKISSGGKKEECGKREREKERNDDGCTFTDRRMVYVLFAPLQERAVELERDLTSTALVRSDILAFIPTLLSWPPARSSSPL